jgi:hypothetical protein
MVPALAVAQLRVTCQRRLGGVAIAEWGLMSQIDRAKGHTWGSDLRDRESLKAEGRRFDSASDHSIPGHLRRELLRGWHYLIEQHQTALLAVQRQFSGRMRSDLTCL